MLMMRFSLGPKGGFRRSKKPDKMLRKQKDLYMLKGIRFLATLFLMSSLSSILLADSSKEWSVRPLADNYYELYHSPDANNIYIYTPSLCLCPNGRIIATFGLGGPKSDSIKPTRGKGKGFVYASDDHGKSWGFKTNFPIVHARAFVAGKSLYVLGHAGNLRIICSDDWGETWSEPVDLTNGQIWHGTATNVWYKGDFVYLVLEKKEPRNMHIWAVSQLAPILLRGNIHKDLTKRENWTLASEFTFYKNVKDTELDWFGVPFYDGFFPNRKKLAPKRCFYPAGWLEANVVQISDPKHYWYDPNGHTFHIFMRSNTGKTNLACMVKAVEQPDGSIKTMFETAPSGKKMLYIPFPGGHMRFHVLYDEQTELYWLLGTQSTDSMTRAELLPKDRFATPDNERRRMQLHFSKNMVDWCFAGIVSIGPVEKASRHYACMIIDGEDLHVLSRSGDHEAKDAHDGNIVTFHTVKDFRRLVY